MKHITYLLLAFASLLMTACDAHQDFPDTTIKPCHILCTDGKVVPYSQYEAENKQAIAVVFNTHKGENMEGTGYAVYLWDIEPVAFSDSLGCAKVLLLTSWHMMATSIPTKCMKGRKSDHHWPIVYLLFGRMVRVPTFLRSLRCVCSMLPRILSTPISRNAAATPSLIIPMNVGIGHLQKCKTKIW